MNKYPEEQKREELPGKEGRSELSRAELERLINMSECAMFIAVPGSEIGLLYANSKYYSIFQYTPEEYTNKFGNQLMASILPEDKQKLRNLIARQTAVGGTLHLEYRVRRKDDTIGWISLSIRSIWSEGKQTYYGSCMDVTQTKRSLADIYKAKRDMDLIANSIPGGVIKLRMTDFKLLYVNDGFFRLAGYSKAEYHINFGDHCDQVIHPADKKMVQQLCCSAVKNQGPIGFEYRIVSKSGEIKWSYVNGCPVEDDHGQPVYLCIIMDITSRKTMEQKFEDIAQRTEMLSAYMKETTWTYDIERKLLHRSGNLGTTYSNESVLEGQFQPEQLREILHPEDLERFEKAIEKRMTTLGCTREIYRIKDDKGDYRKMEVGTISVSSSGEEKPDKVFGVTRLVENPPAYADPAALEIAAARPEGLENKLVTMAKSAQAQAEDAITGLVPYAVFLRRAEKMLAERNEGDHIAVLCADINEFRKYSHHYGFSISNEVLKRFSKVLLKYMTQNGMCTRVDGDYFVVIFQYTHHKDLLKSISAMVHYQEELDQKEEERIHFGTTSGLYLVQPEDHELGEILEKADLARRSIKGLRGNHYAIYTDELQKERFKEEEVIREIRRHMQDHNVEICYLPRIQGSRDNIVGCKAIPRIQLKDGQYLESEQLLRYMERGGKLEEFAFYTLANVCCNVGAWKAKGNQVIPFSVEMTASQLSTKNAVALIDDIVVTQNRLEPSDVIFEFQERYFTEMTSVFEMALEQLCRKGYQVVISRFGSDHTAIHSLRNIPITGIKFHGEHFAENMTNDREKIILRKIVEMAKELGMTVACGGIYTGLQEEFAREIGCDMLEGEIYYGAMRNNVFEKCFLTDI